MNVKVGDTIVLVATNRKGSVNGKTLTVRGIIESVSGPSGRDGYLGGYVQARREDSRLRTDAAFYRLNTYGRPQRDDLGRTTAIPELAGKLRHGDATFDFRTHSQVQRDELAYDRDHVLYEAAYSVRATTGLVLEPASA